MGLIGTGGILERVGSREVPLCALRTLRLVISVISGHLTWQHLQGPPGGRGPGQ